MVRKFITTFCQDFLYKNKIKIFSRKSSFGAVFAERFNRTIRDLIKKMVFEQGDAKWIDVLPKVSKQYNNRIHTSAKLSPKDASLKKRRICQ